MTARVQMVTRKQPATIIQPQPPSGGEVDRTLVPLAMTSILFSSFSGYSDSPVIILEEFCCPVTSYWHSRLAWNATWHIGYWPSKTKNQDIFISLSYPKVDFSLDKNDHYFREIRLFVTMNAGLRQRPLVVLGTRSSSF